jgi:UDP-N-acetylglucosamine--N-acetylmuramyl-(pentapeptide) pyrophosphoryl-undecaprenol N-acetylglucosamine transferase
MAEGSTSTMTQNDGQTGLVIACGGTGGHLFPGLAVAESWVARGGRVLLLVSEKPIDRQASEKYRQFHFETIPALPKPPSWSPNMLPFLRGVWRTVGRCRGLFDHFGADAVLGMGGFTSLPPVFAGRRLGLATFVHDSNALPGKANRLTARWCDEVLVGLEAACRHFPKSSCRVTGTPVRDELKALPERAAAAARWGLDPARPTLLVMGGSQGARKLNSLVTKLAPGTQVLHIAGPRELDRVATEVGDRPGHRVLGFCDDMASAYAVADAAVARSGASSLTELAFLGLPSVLVPYPFAAEDHQTVNARVFADAGAAFLEPEAGLTTARLDERIAAMLEPAKRAEMAAAARRLAVDDAAGRVCEAIAGRLGKSPRGKEEVP